MIKLLITDLDDTLYSWIGFFVPAFYGMLDELSVILNEPQQVLIDEYQGWYEIQKAWPNSVTFKQQEDGNYLFTIKTASSYGLQKWLMSMGSSATLIKPESMRKRVKEELESMLQRYLE